MAAAGDGVMAEPPAWLPAVIRVDGEWERVLQRLYGVFRSDFELGRPAFRALAVDWDRRVEAGERFCEGFWHLITRDSGAVGSRLLDPRRAERMPWCVPTLLNDADPAVWVWDYLEGSGRTRTYVWLHEFDYVIILEKKRWGTRVVAFLVTAFHVDGPSSRRRLERRRGQTV